MGGEEHGPAAAPQVQYDLLDHVAADGIEARHRLVEEHQLGVVEERLRQPRALEHALREAPHRHPGGLREPDPVEQLCRPLPALGSGHPEEPPRVVQVFLGGQVVVEVGILRQVAGAVAPRPLRMGHAQHAGGAAVGAEQAQQQLERRRLARAVGPQVAEDFAAGHAQRQLLECAPAPPVEHARRIGLRQPRRLEGRPPRCRSRHSRGSVLEEGERPRPTGAPSRSSSGGRLPSSSWWRTRPSRPRRRSRRRRRRAHPWSRERRVTIHNSS